MTKPRFVVDPAPVLGGSSTQEVAEYLQAYSAWNQRQLDRAHDWWPKDLEDRVQALEEIQPALKGVWPIVDYGYAVFGAEAQDVFTPFAFIGTSSGAGDNWSISLDGYNDFQAFQQDVDTKEAYDIRTDGNGTFAAISASDIVYSTDGLSWTKATSPWTVTNSTIRGLAYDSVNNRWIAVMQHPSNGVNPIGAYIRATSDFSTWTTLYENTTGASPIGIDTDGSGNFLCADQRADYDSIFYSTDNGDTWTEYNNTLPISEAGSVVGWAHDRWYIGSFKGYLLMCDPGSDPTTPSNWSAIQSGVLNEFGGRVIAGFDTNNNKVYVWPRFSTTASRRMYRSTDGSNFTFISHPYANWELSSSNSNTVVYNETLGWLFAAGTQILKSDDGLTWVSAPDDGVFSSIAKAAVFDIPV